MPEAAPFITVIIPVYNGTKFLHRCLDAIFASTYRSFDVIVVDDCSTDDSAEISRSKGTKVLSTDKQSGPAAARNLAAEAATGEILMFVDADVVVKPETLGLVADRFAKRPEISALFGSYDDEPAEQNFLSQYKNLQHHYVHQNSRSDASTFWSGLGAIRREVFISHGGFDCKKFAVPSIEDIDLGFRLRKNGHKILLDRDIQAKHLKKWQIVSHLRTEIFCRAVPWSRLILESKDLVNDMNLKTADRASAGLVALSLMTLPLLYWLPQLIGLVVLLLILIAFLNRNIIRFYWERRGLVFAMATFPWQLLYFLYSGFTFGLMWMTHKIPAYFGVRRTEPAWKRR